MSETSDDRIHAPTPARREQARRDGDIPKSFELAAAIHMIGAILASYFLLGNIGTWLCSWTTETWSQAGLQLTVEPKHVTSHIQNTIGGGLMVLLPFLALLMIFGFASHWLQTGPLFISKKIAPDLSRMGIKAWRQRLLSLEGLAFLFVGIPKTVIAFAVLCGSSWQQRNQFFGLASLPPESLVTNLFALVLTVVSHVAIALMVTSIADYGLRFLSQQKRLRMTDQELRDELRMQNGDPRVRARQRDLRRV
ncbi:MAG: EscU/YscU/HrcU family type III secretion system export apparatus switch protein [Mariniblastus sp.]|nr:EscU/YscU/HrcU family type III secretion system export apparatus switch protein [Mariniblastus sp.]